MKRVLNVGGGNRNILLPSHFDGWEHVLLDVDPKCEPDLLMDARDLGSLPGEEYDAVYCSHNLEHYYPHDGLTVLEGMHHVLRDTGTLHIRVPDIGAVMTDFVMKRLKLDSVLYESPVGPILVSDVIWGYHVEIEESGNDFFAHKTGFTPSSLVEFVKKAGFAYFDIQSANYGIDAFFVRD